MQPNIDNSTELTMASFTLLLSSLHLRNCELNKDYQCLPVKASRVSSQAECHIQAAEYGETLKAP